LRSRSREKSRNLAANKATTLASKAKENGQLGKLVSALTARPTNSNSQIKVDEPWTSRRIARQRAKKDSYEGLKMINPSERKRLAELRAYAVTMAEVTLEKKKERRSRQKESLLESPNKV